MASKAANSSAVPGGNKWKKLGKNGFLSAEDFVQFADNSTTSNNDQRDKAKTPVSLFTYCLGRFGGLLLPKDVSTVNLERLLFVACMDQSHNDTSYRRLNSTDVLKRPSEVKNEASLRMTAIMSLCGVGSMVVNLWSTPIIAQNRFVKNLWSSWTEPQKKAKVVSALHLVNCNEMMIAAIKLNQNAGNKAATSSLSTPEPAKRVKRWIRYARVLVGIPNVTYADS